MAEESELYPLICGADWGRLAPSVQALHLHGRGVGRFVVERGRGLGWLVGWVLGLPPAGEVAVTLEVSQRDGVCLWNRRFGAVLLRTRQWAQDGMLIEAMGGLQARFRLSAEAGTLIFHQLGAALDLPLPLPIPRWLSPRISGRAAPDGDAVAVDVRIVLPLLGVLVGYRGRVVPS